MSLEKYNGKIPLNDYPWKHEIDRLAEWSTGMSSHVRAFCFDLSMSLAYIDATSGIEKYIEGCENAPSDYNAHFGFINLCSPCYEHKENWIYQKAAKPQSGAIGKLSSEIILRFIKKIYPQFDSILSIGGTETADAVIQHKNGTIILAEVKSAPLLTYPVLFEMDKHIQHHEEVNVTTSQLQEVNSALYMHNKQIIPLGLVKTSLWPFKPAVDFVTDAKNGSYVEEIVNGWVKAKEAYSQKKRNDAMYYLANASGHPPAIAKTRDKWPRKESISDSKTSAGMDRTDDIKKGIYQVLKIGTQHLSNPKIKTAIISNLPAYRHGKEYVEPFISMLWGKESDLIELLDIEVLERTKMKWVFDYIITLESPVLRDLNDDAT